MNLKNSLITALGGMPKEEFEKTTNRVHSTDFLRYGTRGRSVLLPDWAEVKIADEDVYKGYPYAVIQKRANKVASLAKENLNTWVKPEALDIFQKKQVDPLHPYLKIIEDSTDFSTKQFWKTICIYLDLAGAYYLGVLRNKIPSKSLDKKNFPDLYSDVSQFILLNPYEIKRVINQNGEVAGYLETKKDGRQREWPPYMIIPMRELNPFDSDKVWSMTDAAKEETYTLKQSGNYTRETLTHNLNAPGIISTDVILDDQKFADFAERVKLHTKGEPLFGNGTGSITWAGMQQDLDKSALLDINEINRTALFAVSGTSKTALGIEQSGTTRETARVQTEQFISDTAQPRLEDIIDFLNLDYKKHYQNEYNKVGYWLEIKSASSRDYTTETQATQMRQAQSNLAFDLMQKGYTMESSYDYAEGKIELSELELEKGLDKPKSEETPPEDTPPENTPSDAPESPTSDDMGEDDIIIVSEENSAKINQNQAPESQGWVGIKTSPIGVKERLSENLKKDLYTGDLQEETSNIPAEEHPHFTAVYGLTAQGMKGVREYINEKIQTLPSVKIKNIDVFEPDRDYKVIVARLEKTADINNLHQELLEREHYDQEFPEYNPHITLCYVNKNVNVDKFLEAFRDLEGQTVKIIGYDLSYPEDTQENTALIFKEGLIPHQELLENGGKGSGNFGHAGREGKVGGSSPKGVKVGTVRHQKYSSGEDDSQQVAEWEETNDPIYPQEIIVKSKDQIGYIISSDSASKAKVAYTIRDKRVLNPFRDLDPNDELDKQDIALYRDYMKATFKIDDKELDRLLDNTKNSLKVNSSEEAILDSRTQEPKHNHQECDCGKVEVLINELEESDGKTLEESYKKFLNDIEEIQKETYKACVSKLTANAFTEDDIIGKRKKQVLINKLKAIIQNYWWILTPLLANSIMEERDLEYGENVKFVFTNALQEKVENNATRVADGHIQTILDDVLTASNKAYTSITEEKAAELIVKAYKENEAKYHKWFEEQPSMAEALKAIRNTDILEENRKIYERANELAMQGYKREDIIKKIREEYKHLSKNRAELIAQNETSRAYSHSQYEADTQFLNSIGQLDTAYKELYSLRPDSEKDKICPICQEIINRGPIPFTQNFVSLGETITAEQDGKVYNFVCNYENIEGGTVHPRCFCRYRLILNGKTLNELPNNEPNPNDGSDRGLNDNNLDSQAKAVNGGPGSGNFGHAGRGKVGGSASDSTIASPETKVTADWLDKHREFAKTKGFTDEWIDQSVKDLKRRELKEKGLKSKTTKQFDKVWEEMQKEGQDYSVWYETVGKVHRAHLARLEELRAGFDKQAQSKAVEELENTGIILRNSDKKWLEEQCPAELINGVRDSLKEAESNGLNLKETQVKFTPATRKGGSCGFDPVNNEVVIRLTRDWLIDTKASELRAKTKGPDGSKWWTNGKINTASTHECGHAMVWQVIKNQNLTPYAYERYCEKIVSQANDIFARQSGEDYWEVRGELSRNEDKKYISSYGSKNAMETIAESYNNPNYSAYTKIVNDLVKDGLAGKTKWTV